MLHVMHDQIDADGLLLRIAKGERAALSALFESEAGRLVAIAQRILRRRDLAEEVVQDTFVAAWRRALAERPSVKTAVGVDYPELLRDFLRRRPSHLGQLAA